MLKRTIFFLSYISFFILVPVCVYFFWPAPANVLSQEALGSGMDQMSDSSSVAIDSLQQPVPTELDDFKMFDSAIESAYRLLHVSFAMLICFPLSILVTFFISLHKFLRPKNKTAGIALGISIFNLLYIPGYYVFMIVKGSMLAFYYFMAIFELVSVPVGKAIVLLLLLLFIASIVLIILGVRRGRKFSKI